MDMNLTEKAAYIKGLAEGLDFDRESKEGKIIVALLDLTGEMAQELASVRKDIDEIDDDLDYLNDYVEELDDDLESVENFISGEDEEDEDEDSDGEDEDEDDDLFDDENCDGDCEGCHGCDGEEYYEIVCPSCGETVCFDQELDPENLVCPACGEKFGCIVDEDDYKKISEDQKDGKDEE